MSLNASKMPKTALDMALRTSAEAQTRQELPGRLTAVL